MQTIFTEDKSKHLPPKILESLFVDNGSWIAGGAARCLFLGSPMNDVDIWFSNLDLYKQACNNAKKYKISSPYETDNATTMTVVADWNEEPTIGSILHKTSAWTLSKVTDLYTILATDSDNKDKIKEYKIQLIKKKFYNNLEEIFNDFDFSVCKVATDGRGTFVFDDQALEDIAHQRLRCTRYSPAGFMTRFIKYNIYGYKMPKDELTEYLNLPDLDWKVKDDSTLY